MDTARFVARRVAFSALVLIVVATVVFFLGRSIGDPVVLLLPPEASAESIASKRAEFGFDRPMLEQYVDYMSGALRLDFRDSIWQRRPSLEVVAERIPRSLKLAAGGFIFAFPTAIALGALAARRQRSWWDRAVNFVSLAGISIVDFWLGIMLILFGAVVLGWFPTGGYAAGLSLAIVLPALTLAARSMGRVAQIVRSALIEEYDKAYVAAYRARGMSEVQIFRHVLKNASIPIVTIAGDEVTTVANGTVVVETVFAWPGLGLLVIQAIERRDLFLLEVAILAIASIVLIANLFIDVLYGLLNPQATVMGKKNDSPDSLVTVELRADRDGL